MVSNMLNRLHNLLIKHYRNFHCGQIHFWEVNLPVVSVKSLYFWCHLIRMTAVQPIKLSGVVI